MLTNDDLDLPHDQFYRKYGTQPNYFTLLQTRNDMLATGERFTVKKRKTKKKVNKDG
jgi:hypothetical protein